MIRLNKMSGITNSLQEIVCFSNESCTGNKKAISGCDNCNKIGNVAVLPVRYSIAHKKSIRGLNTIDEKLKEIIDVNVPCKENSAYIVRKLRKGFLYVYDDFGAQASWLCYKVSERGELEEFPVRKKVSILDIKNLSCTQNGHSSRSSLVSLKNALASRRVYFLFMEVPIRYKRLKEIAADKLWRDRNMQYFDMGNAE